MRFPRRGCPVLQLDGRIPPSDQVADGVAAIERVQEVTYLGCIPDEWALDLRDRDFAALHPREQRLDGLGGHRVPLNHHETDASSRSPRSNPRVGGQQSRLLTFVPCVAHGSASSWRSYHVVSADRRLEKARAAAATHCDGRPDPERRRTHLSNRGTQQPRSWPPMVPCQLQVAVEPLGRKVPTTWRHRSRTSSEASVLVRPELAILVHREPSQNEGWREGSEHDQIAQPTSYQ